MKTFLGCIPCLIRQAIEVLSFLPIDDSSREKILSESLISIAETGFSQPPPVIAQRLHRSLRKLSGVDDPYREIKDRFNSMAVSMLERLTEDINLSSDPMVEAIKLSIAGNVIDCGAKTGLSESEAVRQLDSARFSELTGDIDDFVQKQSEAENILFIADNAGEIVLDRPLIELLGSERVTLAVRGAPVLNDATIDDARAAGLDRIVKVIENGSDAPGTLLEECSREFRKCFEDADLVISKGQGNYETLCDIRKNIFFLLKVKCDIIADHTGYPKGTQAVIRSSAGNLS